MEDKTRSNEQRQNKNRHFKLPQEIIEQYQEMPIFKAITSKKIKPFDVIRLHNLARQLKKQHPDLSSETILQNQIELYLVIQAELKKYFKSGKSDEARKNMDDAIKAKYQELAQNPLINKLYEINFEKYASKDGDKAWINFAATNLQQIMHNQFNFDETQHWDDFIASVDSLTQILESTTKKKEKTPPQNVKKTSADITKAPAVETPEVPVVETTDTTAKPKDNIVTPEKETEEPLSQTATGPTSIVVEETQDDEDTESHTNDDEISSPEEENDNLENNNFNKSWSEFTDTVAKKLEGGKVTNKKCENSKFTAEIEHSKGNVSITATTDNHVSLGAKDTQGNPNVPDQKVFQALAQKALDEGSIINFGNIKTPEFKARLMIACMEKGVEIKGKPKLTDEFLNSIDSASAKRLRILQNKQNTQSQPTPTPPIQQPAQTPDPETSETTPQPVSKSDYEKSRDEREKLLEIKSKTTQGLTPQEQCELDYIKFTQKRKQELEEAIARTGNKIDPRTAEHTKESGYAPKNYPFFPNAREWNGWKLHLDVVPNRDEPTTKAVSEFLEKMQVDHKIANGGENGKGMTIYIGSYDDANKLAQEINSRFGKNIAEPPLYTDQKRQEIDLNKKVTGRFYLQNWYSIQYPRSSIHGICPAEYGSADDENMCSLLTGLAIREQIISKDFTLELIPHDNNFHDRYVFRNLESYCSHKLYQKHLGEFYCGKDADKFEKQIFGDALPPKGSKDRATWDKIADLYIQKSENDYPQGIQKMAELKSKYTPIDFNKVPPLVRPQKSNTGN